MAGIKRNLSDKANVSIWARMAYMTTAIEVNDTKILLDVEETLLLLEVLEKQKGKLVRTKIEWELMEREQ